MSANTNNPDEFITLRSYPRAIVHIDCDAFFTSCEQSRNPALKKRPLATGQERGIVSCPCYRAKALGVARGMPLGQAKKICPQLIVVPSDYELYSIFSNRLFALMRTFTPQVEEYSIDEAFCDLTGLRRVYRISYADMAGAMKQKIQEDLGITVSVGLSLSKILSKICSKQHKPDGFFALPGYALHRVLGEVPLSRVCGFGPNTIALLNKHHVCSVLDYIRKPEWFAKKVLGKIGWELWHELRGEPIYRVSTQKKEKYLTISKSKTFMPPSREKEFLKAQLIRNLESAFIKLRRHTLMAKTLAIYLKRQDFTLSGLEISLDRHSSATLDFTSVCAELFEDIYDACVLYRATGVVLSDIRPEGSRNLTLFEDRARVENFRKLSEVTDTINSLYGKHALHVASSHSLNNKGSHPRSRTAWRKQELLKGETFRKRLALPLLNIRV
ncbi:MAG: DNA polymerase IV [Candidatus Omnitrophica bacterium]|nr:DNA polymerase IV [Candidatus Omnitrophota bacterium]